MPSASSVAGAEATARSLVLPNTFAGTSSSALSSARLKSPGDFTVYWPGPYILPSAECSPNTCSGLSTKYLLTGNSFSPTLTEPIWSHAGAASGSAPGALFWKIKRSATTSVPALRLKAASGRRIAASKSARFAISSRARVPATSPESSE